MPPGCCGALRPEKRLTARSKLPHQKCTGLALPAKPARKRANTGSIAASASRKRSAEFAVVVARARVVGERNRALDLVGRAVEVRRKAVPVEHRDQPLVKRGDAAGIERQLLARRRR